MDAERWRHHREQTAVRHITKYRTLAETDDGSVESPLLQMEYDNLQTAIMHAIHLRQTDELQRLTWAVGQPFDGYLSRYGYWPQLTHLLQKGVELSQTQNDTAIAAAFRADLATVQMWQGNLHPAQENYQAALAILEVADPVPAMQRAIAAIYHHLGNLAQQTAAYAMAHRHYQKALSLHRKVKNEAGIAKALHQLGSLAAAEGKMEGARSFYEESLSISQTMGDQSQSALTIWNLGNLAYREGKLTTAKRFLQQALDLFTVLNDERNRAGVLHMLGQVTLDQGAVSVARHYAEQSLTIKNELGYRLTQPTTLGLLGVIAYAEGDGDLAATLYRQAIMLAEEMGIWQEVNNLRFNLAMLYRLQGQPASAAQLLQAVVATDEQFSLPSLEKDRAALAQVQAKLGEMENDTFSGDTEYANT